MNAKQNFESHPSWIDLLLSRAEHCSGRPAYIYLPNGQPGDDARQIDNASLARRAMAIGASLVEQGAAGGRVPVIYQPGLEFVEAFLGVMFAGATPVPVRAPGAGNASEFLLRTGKILADLETPFLLADRQTVPVIENGLPDGVRCLDIESAGDDLAGRWRHPQLAGDDMAFIQYTSGSTREPKGVRISHRNLLANCNAITAGRFYQAGGVHVGWMPHYHDMGLVGSILGSLYANITAVLMAPQSFLRNPMRWLQAISHYRGSSSGGPNFAYKLLAQRAGTVNTGDLDLSCWEVAYCGAEPIQAEILTSFARGFAPVGFDEGAFLPCYGMAEATLLLTGRKGLKLVERAPVNSDDGSGARPHGPIVSLGKPFDNTEITIIDPAGNRLPEGRVGEIVVDGPGISPGYFGAPAREAPPATDAGSVIGMRTGDLGFLEDGELYVCGRSKDTIIVRGQNMYPQDIEQIAESVAEDLSTSTIAAFALPAGEPGYDEEGFVVLAGVRNPARLKVPPDDLLKLVREKIVERLEIAPATVALVPAREIPRTSSGKIQRSACARKWQGGEFTVSHQLGEQADSERHATYPLLRESLANYENRNTRYQFDLEADIDWSRIMEPGRYFSDEMVRAARVDPDALKTDPEALAFYEWAYALLKAEEFVALEKVVVEWGDSMLAEDTRSRSSGLLVEEEIKHVALFERYSRALREMRPQDVEAVLSLQRIHQDGLLTSLLTSDSYESERHFHYTMWLTILYFEEYTIWLGHVLPRDDPDYQPTWLQAHFYHRREESQHVITDHAYIRAMDLSYEDRMRWSESLLNRIFESTTAELADLRRLTEQRFPALQGKLALDADSNVSYLARFLGHRAFSRTRDSAPYADVIAGKRKGSSPRSSRLPEPEELRIWLRSCLSLLTKTPAAGDADDQPFTDQGLDSLGHITLVAEIDNYYGIDIGLDAPYLHNTIDKLVEHVCVQADEPVNDHREIDSGRLKNCTTLNPGGSRIPLFWIYDSLLISSIAKMIPDEQTVHVFPHEGTDLGPVKYRSIAELGDYYAGRILEACKGRTDEVYVAGYSMGGLVAYETARKLRQAGLRVSKLVLVSPATPPSLINETRNSEMGATYWRHRLGRICRRSPSQIMHNLNLRVRTVQAQRHFRKNGRLPPDLLWHYLRPLYGQAIRTHHIEPYDGDTLLIGEQGFPIDKWLSMLNGNKKALPALACVHEEIKKPKMLQQWLPEVMAEFG